MSLAEDGLVAAGVWVAFAHPFVVLSLVLIVLTPILCLLPKVFRLFRRQAQRIRSLFRSPFADKGF